MTADFLYTPNDRIDFNKKVYYITSTTTIRYKDDTELVHPVLMCEPDKFNDSINYIAVGSPVNRVYFVDDVTYSKQYIEIKCTEDVIASHKSEIQKLTGIVERVSTKARWNLYLQDDKLKTFNMTRFCTIPWTGSFRKNGSKTYSYILTLSGGGTNGDNNNS